MALSSDLVSEFAKALNDSKNDRKEVTVYGTISVQNGVNYVKIDGSNELTPVVSTVSIKDGERVLVTIRQHQAVVTGNLTSPSVGEDKILFVVEDTVNNLRASLEITAEAITSKVEKAGEHESAAKGYAEDAMGYANDAKGYAESWSEVKQTAESITSTVYEYKTDAETAADNAATSYSDINTLLTSEKWSEIKQTAESITSTVSTVNTYKTNAETAAKNAADSATAASTAADNAATSYSDINTLLTSEKWSEIKQTADDITSTVSTVNTYKTDAETAATNAAKSASTASTAAGTAATNAEKAVNDLLESKSWSEVKQTADSITSTVKTISQYKTDAENAAGHASTYASNAAASANEASTKYTQFIQDAEKFLFKDDEGVVTIDDGRVAGAAYSNVDDTTRLYVGEDMGSDHDQYPLVVKKRNSSASDTWWTVFKIYSDIGDVAFYAFDNPYLYASDSTTDYPYGLFQPQGTWDFSDADVIGLPNSASGTVTAVFA